MRGNGDGDALRDGERVALRLVAVVVGVQDPVDFGDAEFAEVARGWRRIRSR